MNKWLKTNNDDNNKRKSNEIVAKLLLEQINASNCTKIKEKITEWIEVEVEVDVFFFLSFCPFFCSFLVRMKRNETKIERYELKQTSFKNNMMIMNPWAMIYDDNAIIRHFIAIKKNEMNKHKWMNEYTNKPKQNKYIWREVVLQHHEW